MIVQSGFADYLQKIIKTHYVLPELNAYGFMCCLGQIYTQLGEQSPNLLGLAEPKFFAQKYQNKESILAEKYQLSNPDATIWENSDLSDAAMDLNDDDSLTRIEREQRLKNVLSAYGHEVEFINEYVLYS